MSHYLTVIEKIIQSEVERQTAELRSQLIRAQREAETARRMQTESWREAHVADRISDYRLRWKLAQEKIDDVIDAVSHEGDSAWMIIERVREIVL